MLEPCIMNDDRKMSGFDRLEAATAGLEAAVDRMASLQVDHNALSGRHDLLRSEVTAVISELNAVLDAASG